MHQYALNSPCRVIRVRGADWRKQNTCRLLISVGRPYHEGDQLDAALFWASRNYEKCIISVGDVLQRYNFVANGLSPAEAYQVSKQEGDLWLQRNRERLQNLSIPYQIIRWEHWLKHEEFPARLEKVNRLYKENLKFRTAIQADVDRFIQARKRNQAIPSDQENLMRKNGTLFLLEETTGSSLCVEETDAVDIYPGSEIKAIRLFREKTFSAVLPGLQKRIFARLDFSR